MNPRHNRTPDAGDAGGSQDQVGTGSAPIIRPVTTNPPEHWDVPEQLRARRVAAYRLPPLPDSGVIDPLITQRAPYLGSPCSRGFACLAQSIVTLQTAHHCPCVEAGAALAGVTGR